MNKHTSWVTLAGVVALSLTGCSSASTDATEAAQSYVTATGSEQCEMNHPDMGGSATDCANAINADQQVWPGHPTDATETTEWKDGYAVTIPDTDGRKDVFGMLQVGDDWKVAAFDIIDESDEATDSPACHALSQEDGNDC